jgi:hypothetical protein
LNPDRLHAIDSQPLTPHHSTTPQASKGRSRKQLPLGRDRPFRPHDELAGSAGKSQAACRRRSAAAARSDRGVGEGTGLTRWGDRLAGFGDRRSAATNHPCRVIRTHPLRRHGSANLQPRKVWSSWVTCRCRTPEPAPARPGRVRRDHLRDDRHHPGSGRRPGRQLALAVSCRRGALGHRQDSGLRLARRHPAGPVRHPCLVPGLQGDRRYGRGARLDVDGMVA